MSRSNAVACLRPLRDACSESVGRDVHHVFGAPDADAGRGGQEV
jgi:hypothetical protein